MKRLATTVLLFLLFIQTGLAQKEKAYRTKEISARIEIDGNLNEDVWNKVKWAGGFIQPESAKKPTFDTQFKILYDDANLYVAIRAFDKQPDSIVLSNKPRDFFDGDYVEINIDSDFDRIDAFSFTITAGGIRGDEYIQTSDNWFNDWNPDWTAKTKIDNKGWIAEIKIPFGALEVRTKKEQWGIQVNRRIKRLDENSSWTSIPEEDKWVEYFGVLKGIEKIPTTKGYSLTEKINPELLKQDFTDLHNSMKSSYPSLYRYHDKAYFDGVYRQTIKKLEAGMNLSDFYRTISSYISKIGDGHMNVSFPDDFAITYYNKLKKLPFKLTITGEGAVVTESYLQNGLLGKGSRIIAMNGKSIQTIVSEMTDFVFSDGYNLTGKYYEISNDFNFYYSLIFGFSEAAEIEFIEKGQTKVLSTKVALMTDEEIQLTKSDGEHGSNSKSFDYKTIGGTAILTIRTFNNAEGFIEFVDDSFRRIATTNIKKLILDFRGNGGGEETNAIHLYSYLTTKPFKYYDRYEVRVVPHKKIGQASTLISFETLNFFADITSRTSKDYVVLSNLEPLGDRFIEPTDLQQPKRENNFSGQVVVLIDGGSFSATSEICAIMKRDKRVTFVGKETGGAFDGNTSGMYDQITLPNSRLKIKVPLVKYVMSTGNCEYLYGRGIIPDYQMSTEKLENDRAIDFSLKYLNTLEGY